MPTAPILLLGHLLPASLLHSQLFAVLAAFVAINTVMYGALAVAKMLPKVYPSDWLQGRNRRARVRGIYPEPSPARRSAIAVAAADGGEHDDEDGRSLDPAA